MRFPEILVSIIHHYIPSLILFHLLAGRTPLHCAVTSDATRVFHVLLKNRQTNINERAHDGTTPMILAVKMDTEGMVEELIQNKVSL